ncbi:MAG: HlyD family secretion protein [Bacteroidetes bacterium CG18_big_fil_WC_8_21_14_2_50_41_14]|nr:MAG: HlyD family secretion protein [Bacteroidetes bacterium CG18_big_fil_WC_8_21_14_2_50_41_14]
MNKTILIILLALFMGSCNSNHEVSDAYGNFESDEMIVSAQGNGELIRFLPNEGDLLKAGEIIGLIDTTDLHLKKKLLFKQLNTVASQITSLDAEMEVQKQLLTNNKVNQKRIVNMFAQGAATQKQLDDIHGLVELNEKQIEAISSRKQNIFNQMATLDVQIEQLNEVISKCLITNPVTGTVLVVYARKGELATIGKPLYKLADVSTVKLKAYISGAQLPQVQIGQEVKVKYDRDANENTTVNGKVVWISSAAEFTPKTIQTKEERIDLVYAIKVEVINDGSIKIGMPGEINF